MNSEPSSSPAETNEVEATSRSPQVRLLFIADVFGPPGMDILSRLLPGLIHSHKADVVIVNGENAHAGRGLDPSQAKTIFELGADVITSGNHIWDHAPIRKEFHNLPKLLRPLNYPPSAGGRGSVLVETKAGIPVAVINLQGRLFLPSIDCPFRTAEREVVGLAEKTKIIFIDFHAESTAEKQALGWFLDGKVSAVIGTHTHVPTADARILPEGTGYLTDAGMTGSFDSVIGMQTNVAIKRMITQTPHPFQVADQNLRLCGVLLDIETETGRCAAIERIELP